MTQNVNKIKTKHGIIKKIQLTPRGPLHNETIYGTKMRPIIKKVKVGAALDEATINKVSSPAIREALLKRLNEYSGNAKKAFTGTNTLDKNPIYLNAERTKTVPALVKTIEWENYHPIRKPITPDLKVDKVIDKGWRFLFTMKQNEYFVFPNEATGFIPSEVDLTDEANYGIISPNLYRVQKMSRIEKGTSVSSVEQYHRIYTVMSRIEKGTSVSRDYWFRHHLETILNDDSRLKNSAFKRINSLKPLEGIIKVRINSIGKIVAVGEYD